MSIEKQLDRASTRAILHYEQALAHCSGRRLEQAIASYEQALEIYQQICTIGDRRWREIDRGSLSLAHYCLAQTRRAIRLGKQTLADRG